MTKTARDLRSAAHALRTAANALEETVTALRALSDDLNEPDPEPAPDRYQMLYCDNAKCRVNTFERGDGTDSIHGTDGLCPGCGSEGEELR